MQPEMMLFVERFVVAVENISRDVKRLPTVLEDINQNLSLLTNSKLCKEPKSLSKSLLLRRQASRIFPNSNSGASFDEVQMDIGSATSPCSEDENQSFVSHAEEESHHETSLPVQDTVPVNGAKDTAPNVVEGKPISGGIVMAEKPDEDPGDKSDADAGVRSGEVLCEIWDTVPHDALPDTAASTSQYTPTAYQPNFMTEVETENEEEVIDTEEVWVQEMKYNPGTSQFSENPSTETLQEDTDIVAHLSNHDIRGWVRAKADLFPGLEEKLNSRHFKDSDRKNLVKIVVSAMCEQWGNMYPAAWFKESVAKAIVSTFPRLGSKVEGRSHESFFDMVTKEGYIEWRLKTMRKHLPSSEKRKCVLSSEKRKAQGTSNQENSAKRGKSLRKECALIRSQLSESVLNEKVAEMKSKEPTESTKKDIELLLFQTRPNRYHSVQCSDVSVSDILNIYPRLKDYEGEMIDLEFKEMYPEHDVFLKRFSTYYAPRILRYCKQKLPHLLFRMYNLDIHLQALTVLVELLPPPNHTKSRKGQNEADTEQNQMKKMLLPNPHLIQFVDAKEDLHKKCAELRGNPKQPLLICSYSDTGQQQTTYFIKVESEVFPVGNSAIVAFDRFFKLHVVFRVNYPDSLVNFYNFMESVVYNGLNIPKSCCDNFNTILSEVDV